METTSEIVLRIWLLPEIFFVLSSALEAENTINAKTFTQQRKQSTKAEQMYAKTINGSTTTELVRVIMKFLFNNTSQLRIL